MAFLRGIVDIFGSRGAGLHAVVSIESGRLAKL